ncbi:arylsulfatase [Paenibacillus alkaliterrae]|uniref:arylsulfatase n=1 Tax=Paenibacillus alkaliterrae TaxID=320909 RepID=UPI001F00D790|nr:arylsulfatase [Paenibacillus alkaliterrae]MCF2941073.1 arylsulfatase [Paenibacillus alkaliterrae]
MSSKQPNIVMIMTDQQRWDTLGSYGNEIIETVNLDALASEGTVFEHAYTPSPSCVPARASLLTGMDPWHTGILGMGAGQGPMETGFAHTLPGVLADAGYHTQGIGKMHFYPQRSLNGFHHTLLDESGRVEDRHFISDYRAWFDRNKSGPYDFVDHGIHWNSWMARPYHAPEYLHPTNWTVNESIAFIQRRDPRKPLFLKTSFARPHSPYDAPPVYFDLYERKRLPDPFVGDWAHIHDKPEDAVSPVAWRGVRKPEEIRRARAGYYGLIHHIDHQIGRLIQCLQREGLYENTMIAFLSDHGDMLGDHNLWRKTCAYEGSAHIPMIVKLPRSCGRTKARVTEPVTIQDVMPTILDIAGLDIPEALDGRSMAGLMQGTAAADWRKYVHGEHCACYSDEQEMHYLTDGRTKYIWFPRLHSEQLFDLESDPGECRDLANRPDERQRLLHWRRRLVDILAKRNAGLTDGADLVCQAGKPYIVSPHYEARVNACSSS